MTIRILVLPLLSILLVACSIKNVAVQTPVDHPANPRAMESAFTPPANVFLADATISAGPVDSVAHAEHDKHAVQGNTTPDHAGHPAPQADKPDGDHAEHHAQQAPAAEQVLVDKLVAAYLALSNLLAQDKIDGAATQLSAIHHAAHDLSDNENEKIAAVAERIAKAAHGKAEDIKAVRASFKTISPDVVALVHLLAPSAKVAPEIRQAYCPMANAPWLQLGDKVTNPYFGSEMLRCGKITETLKAKDEEQK